MYDWKETSLADEEIADGETSALPTPDEFWDGTMPVSLQVGGRDPRLFKPFKSWLADALK